MELGSGLQYFDLAQPWGHGMPEWPIWKIDYYDRLLSAVSPDPADPSVTRRVMTVMLAEEY